MDTRYHPSAASIRNMSDTFMDEADYTKTYRDRKGLPSIDGRDPLQTVVAGSFQETKSAPRMPNLIRNVPQIPRPVDVAIQLHGAPLVIHLRPAIAIGCLHDGCGGLAWKQHNRLILAGEQHPDRPH